MRRAAARRLPKRGRMLSTSAVAMRCTKPGGFDLRLSMLLAGFSFDSYTEMDKATGVWLCDGGTQQRGIGGVQTVMLSPGFVRDACRGILRVRVVDAVGLREVPIAGSVGVSFTLDAGPGSLVASTRCSTKRGVLSGIADWSDMDESIYLYTPRGCRAGPGNVDSSGPVLHVEVQNRDILDMQAIKILGTARVPFTEWSSGKLQEAKLRLQAPEPAVEDDDEKTVPTVRLQLQFDPFRDLDGDEEEVEAPEKQQRYLQEMETLDDVTPEVRSQRRRYGTAVPQEILEGLDPKDMSYESLQRGLRRRALPDREGREVLEERLVASMEAEKKLREAGGWLDSAMTVANSVSETLSGDMLGAFGAGLMTGAQEVPGVKELFSGDFSGAMDQRKKVFTAAFSGEGRDELFGKVDAAMGKAKQQAMLRLANGMELMSVRRGAWKMLEAAVLDEGRGAERFSDYEQLAYLEAGSTNTECWVWRLKKRRRLLVAFRGTSDFGDVLVDISATPRDCGELGKVHDGFSRAYDSVREALRAVLARGCRGSAEGWEILFTGHSLGGALATLASLDVARLGAGDDPSEGGPSPLDGADIAAVTFGAPRVGNAQLCATYDAWVPRCWRVYSCSDIIPTVPPTTLFGFTHAGIAVELDPDANRLTIRGRTPGLEAAAAKASGSAAPEEIDQSDIWSSFDSAELSELRRVLGKGTQAVGEHMEDNYFERFQECLSEDLKGNEVCVLMDGE